MTESPMDKKTMDLLTEIAESPGRSFVEDQEFWQRLFVLRDGGLVEDHRTGGYNATPKGLDLVTKSEESSEPIPQPPAAGVALDKVTRFMMVLIMRHLPIVTVSNALLEAVDLPSEAISGDRASDVAAELARALLA